MSDRRQRVEPLEPGVLFDERAPRYDATYDERSANGYALRSRMAGALALVGFGPGRALDAGMGAGRLLAELAKRGWTVAGVDASAEMVSAARRRLPQASSDLVEGKIEALPFSDGVFDVAVATGVLEYSQPRIALRELARVVRPGGSVVVSYPNPQAPYVIWQTHVWYSVVRAAKRAGRRPPRTLPRAAPKLTPDQMHALLSAEGLLDRATLYSAYLVLPSPLDVLFPALVELTGKSLERRARRVGTRVGAQVLYKARKSSLPEQT